MDQFIEVVIVDQDKDRRGATRKAYLRRDKILCMGEHAIDWPLTSHRGGWTEVLMEGDCQALIAEDVHNFANRLRRPLPRSNDHDAAVRKQALDTASQVSSELI